MSKIAAAANVSKQLRSFAVAGEREVTDDVYRKIATGLIADAGRRRMGADKLDEMAGRMLADLERE
jgi:hypothetical protein